MNHPASSRSVTSGHPPAEQAAEVLPNQRGEDPRVGRTRVTALETVRAILVEEGWEAVTHLRVAERAGLGRATIYRHWPTRLDLLVDALSQEALTIHTLPVGDLRRDLIAELEAFRRELVQRRLGRVLTAMLDRAEWEPEVHRIKAALVDEGMSVLRQVLHAAQSRGELAEDLDIELSIAELVGPLLYQYMFSDDRVTSDPVPAVVDTFLAVNQRSAPRPAPRHRGLN
jgi:AcrR family transcriptional regulator